eukprot:CAMPEP_0182856028 /NCGR_PEP_ID=MMETSP0034_2-20130328/2193_1 /TAXON_ID=156128 /ORGANISM="Nephroselmis pyriformis, Strain CCMP717" /LENGTH=728 /DNA_ID=CAMNT_0024987063 /DNA_START=30 /DNA_END=2216 /DNA_ORIENTATION=-
MHATGHAPALSRPATRLRASSRSLGGPAGGPLLARTAVPHATTVHARGRVSPRVLAASTAAGPTHTDDKEKVLAGIMGLDGKKGVTMRDHLAYDDGGPRFFSPINGPRGSVDDTAALPFMLFLPGLDGTGMNVYNQFTLLSDMFDIRCFKIPVMDKTSFEGLVDIVEAFLRKELANSPPGRPAYLMGESFGGLLSLAVALRVPDLINRVVLVNPATAFPRSVWPTLGPALLQIPTEVYDTVLPVVLQPLITNPILIAQARVDPKANPLEQAAQVLDTLNGMIPDMQKLAQVLPKATLQTRLGLLEEGNAFINGKLKDVTQRVLVVAGTGDWLIPSEDEASRLRRTLPRCSSVLLEGRSHAMLMEESLDIGQVIRDNGFYTSELRMSSTGGRKRRQSSRVAGAVEVPTLGEVEKEMQDGQASNAKKFNSPVFFSTLPGGKIVQGLDGFPEGRPILLVGNHQTFAPDMPPLIGEFVREKGILPRGLAHPIAFQMAGGGGMNGGKGGEGTEGEESGAGGMFSNFGAVPVSARNLYRLMQSGEVALIYPGGVREAFKKRGEDYQLFWPTRPELIRMAAKHGATIVPLAAVGADDNFDFVADQDDVLNTPFLGDFARSLAERAPQARRGAAKSEGAPQDTFVFPVIRPKVPNRFYFLLGEPIKTEKADLEDPARVDALYKEVKGSLEGGIDYLLRKRKDDPYGDFLMRMLYESTWGGEQAPTFKPWARGVGTL